MKHLALIFSIVFTMTFSLLAQAEKSFEQAGRLYQAGKYDFALEKYLSIKKSGYESSELNYNIGNSYYKIANYPKAILYYEKALKLNPSDEDAQINLKISNLKIVDKVSEIEPFFIYKWLKIAINFFSPTLWAVFFIITLFSASAFLILQIVIRKPSLKKTFFALAILSLCFAVINLSSAIYANYLINASNSAIVMSQAVNVKSGLDPTADVSFVLHEGTKVNILEVKDNWLKIKLSDGREGWMPQKDAENI